MTCYRGTIAGEWALTGKGSWHEIDTKSCYGMWLRHLCDISTCLFANVGYTDLHDALEADAVVYARLQGIEFLELREDRRQPMLALVKLRTLDVLHGALPENYVSARRTFDALVLVDRED